MDSVFLVYLAVDATSFLPCPQVPNPLFDLAGITCGHFLVPFWTFFGATLIGKAVFKMLLQVWSTREAAPLHTFTPEYTV